MENHLLEEKPLTLEEKLFKIINAVSACSLNFILTKFPESDKDEIEIILKNCVVKKKTLKDISNRRGLKDNRFWICGNGNPDDDEEVVI